MAQPLLSLIENINEKISRIAQERRTLLDRIRELEEERDRLKEELQEKDNELSKTRLDVEFLTMSHRLAENPDSIIATRRHIARLIRTIDRCISMLKEE